MNKFLSQEEWNVIKLDERVLKDAIKVVDGKLNNEIVCECILFNYYDVSKDIYQELVNTVLSDRNLLNINGIQPFYKLILSNIDLKLSESQKELIVREAYFMPGSIYNPQLESNYDYNDIRFYVMLNNNWSEVEKKNLAFDFYATDIIVNDFIMFFYKELEKDTKIFGDIKKINDTNGVNKIIIDKYTNVKRICVFYGKDFIFYK